MSSVRAVSGAESTQAVPAVKGYTKTQLTLRPQRPRQVPRVTESDAHVRISHKDGTCTRRSCAARRACSCGLVIPPRGGVFLGFVSVCLFWGLPWCPLCSRCGRLGSSLWAFLSCWGLLRAFSRLACRRSVLVVCLSRCALALLSACLRFALCLLAALARALLPSFSVAPGPSSFRVCFLFPLWVLCWHIFLWFSGDAGRTMKNPSSAARIARITAAWSSQSSQ